MINLIPNEEKKQKSKNFLVRFSSLLFLVLGFCFLLASLMILPAYFYSSFKKGTALNKLNTERQNPLPVPDQDTLKIVEDLKTKVELLENLQKKNFSISNNVLNQIISAKMSDIKITGFFYENSLNEGKKLSLSGLAPNRERLASFRSILMNSPAFTQVDLPISNFVKGSNIKFIINLIPISDEH